MTDILVTLPTDLQETFFTPELRERLEALGEVEYNENGQFTRDELADRLSGVAVIVTGWGTPTIDDDVLAAADALELLAHTGGSVADLASDELYHRGITVCSANRVMARFVAEHVLGHTLAAERSIVTSDRSLRSGGYERDVPERSVFGADIGFVGLGTVGRHLLALLEPFDVDISIYDPYVSPADIAEYDFVEMATLTDALASDIVSIHAARTPETIGMIGAEELAAIPDGALLVNTARAELFDEQPLLDALEPGRFRAALDVFHEEPLPSDSPLRAFDTVQLTPHLGGSRIRTPFTAAMIDEIERHLHDHALQHEIPHEQYSRMTR